MEAWTVKRVLLLFIIFTISSNCRASVLDTSNLLFNAKMNIIPFKSSYMNMDRLKKILDADCSFKFINSKGFDSVVFFQISISRNSKDEFSIYMTQEMLLYDYTYIFGYDYLLKKLLLLKGFYSNDFNRLYTIAEMYSHKNDLSTAKDFCKNHYVEGLDLFCLYQYYFNESNKVKKTSSYECLTPNTAVEIGWAK